MTGDNHELRTYAAHMERGNPFIRLRLEVDQPVELGEFVGAFTAMAAEFDRYAKENAPGVDPGATLFVKEVRAGSIEADLIPWVIGGGLITAAASAVTVFDFVEKYGGKLKQYLKPGGRVPEATKADLKHFHDQVAAIAKEPGSNIEVAAIEIVEGKRIVRSAFRFNSGQAAEITNRIEEHQAEITHRETSDHPRVSMVFTRTDTGKAATGKRSGEKVRIEAISPKPRPLIYASDLAEQRIKHEIRDGEDNVYKKVFIVDVNVETLKEKPFAYRVTHVHQVIDAEEAD